MTTKDEASETLRVTADAESLRSQLPPRAALHLYHRDGNTVLTLAPNDAVVVGRSRPADVVISDPSMSRQHARFSFDGDAVCVEDLGSMNGTAVNGEPVKANTRVVIGPEDDVAVGSVIVVVHRLSRGERRPVGFDSHEKLADNLRDEIGRARHFNRSVALMFIAARSEGTHVSSFAPEVQKHLRSVDRMALYSPQVLEVLLPEYRVSEAKKLAEQIVGARKDLAIGVVAFPDEGDSVDRMLDAARDALKHARGGSSGVFVVESGPRIAPVVSGDAPLALTAEMKALFSAVEKMARRADRVLVTGETGAGKEVVAQMLHSSSPRAGKPLISVNCGALPATLLESTLFGHTKGAFTGADKERKGVFEAADGGTVFLDEIGELPAAAQAALLRVLETKKVSRLGAPEKEIPFDVCVVAATHRDLQDMAAEGTFRVDLLYRLNGMTLHVPPLRQRREEIPHLAQRFMQRADTEQRLRGFDASAIAALCAYDWPGNVRELRNAVDRAVVLANGNVITVEDLPDVVRRARSASERTGAHAAAPAGDRTPTPKPMPAWTPAAVAAASSPASPSTTEEPKKTDFRSQLRSAEAKVLIDALERNGGVQTAAARDLEMPIRTFVHKMKVLGIKKDKNKFVVIEEE